MTLNLEIPSVRYTADGIITTFAFVFTVSGDSELVVTVDDTEQVENIDYTIENVTEFGGDIEFIIAPIDQLIILIQRRTPQTQQIDFEPFSEFPADTLEGGLDKLQKQMQEQHGGVFNGDNIPPNVVLSVLGRVGNILAQALDYIATQIGYDNTASALTTTDVQAAIDELDSLRTFLALKDTPNSFLGQEFQIATVREDELGLEFQFGILDLLGEAFPSGLVDGGELNILAGPNIQIIEGQGIIINSYTNPTELPIKTRISWATQDQLIVAPSVAGSVALFSMTNGGGSGPIPGTNLGVLVERVVVPTPEEVRDEVFIGFSINNGTTWNEVSSPIVLNSLSHSFYEYVRSIGGFSHIESGGAIHEAAVFTLDQDAGIIWEINRNWHVNRRDPNREAFIEKLGFQWRYTNRDFTDVGALTDTVDATQYDNAGTVQLIGGSPLQTTIQRLFLDPSDNLWVMWGQNLHFNFDDAIAGIGFDNSNTEVPDLLSSSIFLGFIISDRMQTDWGSGMAVFVSVVESISGGGGSSLISGTPPASASDVGMPGEIRYDPDFFYVCIATDTWKRVGISTWV